MIIATPRKQATPITTARVLRAPALRAFFTLDDLGFFARVPLLMRIDVLLVKTDRRICGANRLPAAPARTRGVNSGGCGSCGSADFVSGPVAEWHSQFRDRPDKDRRAVSNQWQGSLQRVNASRWSTKELGRRLTALSMLPTLVS